VNVPVEITVERDGISKLIKYFARGDAVDGTGWERVAKVSDSACAQ
jgi:hypothetical protein